MIEVNYVSEQAERDAIADETLAACAAADDAAKLLESAPFDYSPALAKMISERQLLRQLRAWRREQAARRAKRLSLVSRVFG